MALVTCAECSKSISSDAAACPHCGKPKAAHSSRWPMGCAVFVAAAIAAVSYFAWSLDPQTPECTTWRAKRFFTKAFESSPLAQSKNLQVISVTEQKQVSDGPLEYDTVCSLTFVLNNAEKVTYTFQYEPGPEGGYVVKGTPQSLFFW